MHVRYLQHQHEGTVQLLLMPLSTAASSIKSSKWVDDEADCDAVPLPIQTFLWRQTNPFLGAKTGKLHEASCVTLERVVVQNILHGLSPSLSDALNSVTRWKLIRAALPHVIQCCGSLLEQNVGQKGLPPSLQKILYILHWMLLHSAAECAETSSKAEESHRQGLFSLSSIQLFVYLIAPLCDSISEEDISGNIRLESGLKIWQSFWQFRQPDVWCFSAPVKQRKDGLPHISFTRKQASSTSVPIQGIYLGDEEEKPRRPSVVPPPKPPRSDQRVLSEKRRREKAKVEAEKQQQKSPEHNSNSSEARKPSELLIDVVGTTRIPVTSIVRSVSDYKAGSSSMEQRVTRIPKSGSALNAFDVSPSRELISSSPSIYTSETSLRLLEEVDSSLRLAEDASLSAVFAAEMAPLVNLNDICSGVSVETESPENNKSCNGVVRPLSQISDLPTSPGTSWQVPSPREAPPLVLTRASTNDESMSCCSQQTVIPLKPPMPPRTTLDRRKDEQSLKSRDASTDEELEEHIGSDPTVASFLDVAVIRALLIAHWNEQGIYWAMRYLLNRLEEIQNYYAVRQSKRQRSNSLPGGAKRHDVGIDTEYQNATWDDFKLKTHDELRSSRLHVAFTDNRRKSSDNALAPISGHEIRRCSLNIMKKERNRSDPSLNNSMEVLSIRDDSESMSNISPRGIDKKEKSSSVAAQYYPEALGSSNFIEKNGKISLTVIVRTVNLVMERCSAVRLCELALNISDTLLRTPADQSYSFFSQLTMMVFRIYLSLGCPHGCNDGVKSQHADFLRLKAKTILATLERLEQEQFRKILRTYVEDSPCQQVLDLLHSLTAFCRAEISADGRRHSDGRLPSYRNRFNEKDKGVEGRIVGATFKTFVSKLATITDQLEQPENMSLLQDVRMLVSFVQDQHGNPFRRVALSALLDAIEVPIKVEISESTKKESIGEKNSPNSLGAPSQRSEASLRRGIFKKKERSGQEDSDVDSSPSTPRTASSVDEGIHPLANSAIKKKSAPKLHFAFNLLKNMRTDADDENSDSENADDSNDSDLYPSSKYAGGSKRADMGEGRMLRLWGQIVPPAKRVNVGGILEGTKRFAFLLETARPGTFPDAPLMAAILHLKSPVLARAALLLECSHLVSRCNRGQWPEWIRSSHHRTLSTLGAPLANRGTPSATRRMHAIQRSAGRHFYQWALHMGEELSKQLDIQEELERKSMLMNEILEDFFDESTVNDYDGQACPPALQMIGVMLLLEITAFLRETFRVIPRSKNNKAAHSSGWEKLLSHRRWSILSNTFNTQGSMNSMDINSSIHLNERERRISLSTAEGDSPRGSRDGIDEIAQDKKAARPPSLSVRLLSRQSTHEESGGSTHGSTKSITYVAEPGRRVAAGRQRLLKRGSPMGTQPSLENSHKRRSFRTRKASKQPHSEEIEADPATSSSLVARESLKPCDELSLASPTETVHMSHPSSQHGSNAGAALPAKTTLDDEEHHISSNFPWIKVVIKIVNSFDFNCTHDRACTSRCFLRIQRQCHKLTEALGSLYGLPKDSRPRLDKRKLLQQKFTSGQQALRRPTPPREPPRKANKISLHCRQSAAVPRRESSLLGPYPEGASKAIKALLMEKMMQEKEKEKEREKEKEDGMSKKPSVDHDLHSESTLEENLAESNAAMLEYLNSLVLNLAHASLSSILKAALLLSSDQYKQLIQISWKLLLDEDPHVVASAASIYIAACVRRAEDALAVAKQSFESTQPAERSAAIQRFYALWRNRCHTVLKMEDGAAQNFKVPPANIDFAAWEIGQKLPPPVVDPPWMPHLRTKIEELSLKEEEHATSQTIMTMTRTRRKQKQEMVRRAVREAEERQCEQRQVFRLRASAIMQLAAFDQGLFVKEHQADLIEETDVAHHAARHQIPVSVPQLPSSLLSVVPLLIEMLDDPQVDVNGLSVGDVAKKVIWTCLVEDPPMFLRPFLEKLTNRERQEHQMSLLRKLILRFNPLPSQTACCLLNYLFGFVLHYVRGQYEGAEKAYGLALSLMWILAPNVQGVYFKDLKQTMKKEGCDHILLITANVPSAKKIIVHGPDSGQGGIPSQFPVHEDTQFQQILSDSLEFFNIEDDVNSFYLTDSKTGQIHLPSSYVRDFYFFHRTNYPQLTLVKLDPELAQMRMKHTAYTQRFIEVGKVLFTHNILKYSPQNVIAQRIFFLHDELTHLPSFPRKCLETCFGLHHGEMGDQLKAVEAMHKFTWAKLISDMFEKMENAFMFADLHLFINVINGIMIMHCEDALILRRCAATYISMCIHFNTLFASQGFFLIMPTILRCYSQRQTNRLFCSVVEFMCRQFYVLHRKPFLLQMCGSVSNILDVNSSDFDINPMRVKAKYWFYLLRQMENMTDDFDQLDILGLVPYEKPLKALDLCYRDDVNSFCVLTDAVASCICVCAVAPESKRSCHMLMVMAALLPHLIKRMEEDTAAQGNTPVAAKTELAQWATLCVEMKALINCCEVLARGPQRAFDLGTGSERGKSFVADSPQFFDPPTTNEDENSRPFHLKEKRSVAVGWDAAEVEEQHKEFYRRPRDTLLCLAANFLELATPRLKELSRLSAGQEHVKIPEIMDHKSHVKLSEVALSLLKIAPYDSTSMALVGLQKYFTVILPVTDWSIECNRSALNIILRRLDKTISKIAKKQSIRRRVNWTALSNWITGLCDTLSAFPYVAHLHPLKTTAQLCLRIMVGDACHDETTTVSHPSTVLHPATPPTIFCQAVLRLTIILMQALGQFTFSLELLTSAETLGNTADRLEATLCHLLIPLCLRLHNNPKEASVFQAKDLAFCLQLMQNAVSPPVGKQSVAPLMSTSTLATTFIRSTQAHEPSARQGSVSVTDKGNSATVSTHRIVRESICQSIFLTLKVLMLCFSKLMTTMWPRVTRLVKELLTKKPTASCAIAFVDFLISSDLPICLLILPVIYNKTKQKAISDQESLWQSEIIERIEHRDHQALPLPVLIDRCAVELSQLKEELSSKPLDLNCSYTPTMTDAHSDSSAASLAPRGAPSRQSIDRRASAHGKKTFPAMKETVEGTILEDTEDEIGDNQAGPSRVAKSPSVPLAKNPQHPSTSPRTRSHGGFGMWRSVRRKSRNVSMESEIEPEKSVELQDMNAKKEENHITGSGGKSVETLILPLHETVDTNRQRFVSFSTPKRRGKLEDDDEEFQIFEQHQLV